MSGDWSSVPIDDLGYLPSAELLELPDEDLRNLIDGMHATRYAGWRNHDGLWREVMGLDELTGKDVIEWGSGCGLEALELARRGNRVTVADIFPQNVDLAARVLRLHGFDAHIKVIGKSPPFVPDSPGRYDVFYSSGVLHHIPEPVPVMQRAHQLLRPGGQVRLMVYSDEGWRVATGTEPPEQPQEHPAFGQFVRFFDDVGSWADWYDAARLEARFGEWFTVERFEYLTPDRRYCAAILGRR